MSLTFSARQRGVLWKAAGVALALLIVVAATAAWLLSAPQPAYPHGAPELASGGNPERGRLVFAAGDCASCHASPGQSERFRLGGGTALETTLGVFRPPNISPDPQDGIGRWSTADRKRGRFLGA